ncbi:unnamed protein product [Cylindrotheca closterium]|uniref:Uncharacterized protein n=1 Tax=Cylindrotheca closterium TaxID=2856 RepID=A0AAD2G1R9_9STRA|nr:unnamed protein product [Cylindrotheca closterium]
MSSSARQATPMSPIARKYVAPKETKIRFSKYDQVRPIPHVNDFSDRQIKECYYGHEELRAIRKQCAGIVKHVNKGGASGGDGFFLRGLDQHTIEYKRSQDVSCKNLYNAVHRMQRYQKLSGKDVSEKMSEILGKISAPAVAAAQVAAISDLFSSYKGTWSNRSVPVMREARTKPDEASTYFQYAMPTKDVMSQ